MENKTLSGGEIPTHKNEKFRQNKKLKENSKESEKVFIENIVSSVNKDFFNRREKRLLYERQWELNLNFLEGNQYCDLYRNGDIIEDAKEFNWQKRRVFNHIAPIIDSRLARFSKINPSVGVRPKTEDDEFIKGANLAEKLIDESFKKCDMQGVVKKVTEWSECCGTGFYKVVWRKDRGDKIGILNGIPVYNGDVEIIAVSPFEIFPDSLYSQDIEDCKSIIHARAMSVDDIKEKYGVEVKGEEIDVFSLYHGENNSISIESGSANTTLSIRTNQYINREKGKSTVKNSAVVIEKYERPTEEFPKGRLITVAGDKLLYYGELPYINDEEQNYSYIYPFIRQKGNNSVGSFFGTSIIERMIPIQRAYNAVKNRKHEFLNRLSCGILTVEDGSLDADDLAEEGLSPGKIIVYRQGSTPPKIMEGISMPDEFNREEEKLLNEFVVVSGVSDVASSTSNASVSSGSALEILVEQDNERMIMTADEIRKSYVLVAKAVIKLYSLFMKGIRPIKYVDNLGKTRVCYLDRSAVCSDDCFLTNQNELIQSESQKREAMLKVYNSGLLNDENGNVKSSIKEKVLSILGYKDLDSASGIPYLHQQKAENENNKMVNENVSVDEIDDHNIHIEEHTRYFLIEYEDMNSEAKDRFTAHINEHKKYLEQTKTKNIEE